MFDTNTWNISNTFSVNIIYPYRQKYRESDTGRIKYRALELPNDCDLLINIKTIKRRVYSERDYSQICSVRCFCFINNRP